MPAVGADALAGLDSGLLLFTREGELIEQLGPAAGIPGGIQAVGTDSTGRLLIKTARGAYRTDENFIEWTTATATDVTWSIPVTPGQELSSALRNAWRGTGLSLERVLLDLHSGRILGEAGVWLVDAAALLFLLLAGSGVWLWGRRRASARAHERNIKDRSTRNP